MSSLVCLPCSPHADDLAPAGIPGRSPDANENAFYRGTNSNRVNFALAYVDAEDTLLAARDLRSGNDDAQSSDVCLVIECPILFEAVRPFLEALRNTDPLRLPFADYIRHADPPRNVVGVPAYAAEPRFRWDLSVLLRDEQDAEAGTLTMDATDSESVQNARTVLRAEGKLDPR